MGDNNMAISQARIDQLLGFENNQQTSNITINNTLKIEHSLGNSVGKLHIRDRTNNDSFNTLYCDNDILYFGNNGSENQIINGDNVVSEINNAFYPTDGTSNLAVSNISVLGGSSSSDFGYINFDSTGGAGIRYNKSSNTIQSRNSNGASWSAIGSGSGSNLATNITSPANNQLLQYNASSTYWENKTNVVLPGTLTISNNLIVSDDQLIVDSSSHELLQLTSSDTPVNYIKVSSADTGNDPIIESVGNNENIDLQLKGKGTGQIYLNSDVNINGFIQSKILNYTESWSSGSGNSVDITLSSDIIILNMSGKADGDYFCTIQDGSSGQHILIVFNEDPGDNITVRVDFGANNLTTGSGLARYLTFNKLGQSASLVYIGSPLDRWVIKNTGALCS
jgi:hypothetical protein